MRLAYVAATRARDRLILVQPRWSRQNLGSLDHFVQRCLQGDVPETLQFQQEIPAWEGVEKASQKKCRLDRRLYSRIWEGRFREWAESQGPLLHNPTSKKLEKGSPEPVQDQNQEISRLIGSLVHQYLERFLTEANFSLQKLQSIVEEIESKVDLRVLQGASKILQNFYRARSGPPSGAPYLRRVRQSRILARELPLYLRQEDRVWNGVLDLLIEDEDGTLYAVDYKTSRPVNPLPESFSRQQSVYSSAVGQLFPGRDVRFEFWWLASSS